MHHPRECRLTVLTTSRRPSPILPVDYSWFVMVQLPGDFEEFPLEQQLTTAEAVVTARGERHYFGPFGFVLGHEARISPNTRLYLNRAGVFLDWGEVGNGQATAKRSNISALSSSGAQCYVVGCCEHEFYSLLPARPGPTADKESLEDAQRFAALADAIAASGEHGGGIFELVCEGPNPVLRELLVDLRRIERVPLDRSYHVGPKLLVGPNFVGHTVGETRDRVAALLRSNVGAVVSLGDRDELFSMRRHLSEADCQDCFETHIFPLRDGAAPSCDQMVKILDVIDEVIESGRKVYLHCMGGRGRSGTVVGCLLSRHDVAQGLRALNKLAELRFTHGLFKPSPETQTQRQTVLEWRKAQ